MKDLASKEIHRLGDVNNVGAAISSTKQTFAKIGGKPIATNGDDVEDHGDGIHNNAKTANGADWARINGIPINRQGDADTCGHTRASGADFARMD